MRLSYSCASIVMRVRAAPSWGAFVSRNQLQTQRASLKTCPCQVFDFTSANAATDDFVRQLNLSALIG